MMYAFEKVAGKFRSGNSVPIERAVIKADEWREMVAERNALAARVERLEGAGDHLRYIWDGTHNLPPDAEIDEACKNWSDARKEAKPAALARVKAEAAESALKSVKVECIGYTWDAGRFGRQFTTDRDVAVRVQQDGVDVHPVAIAPQSLSAVQRLIDEAGE